MFTFIKAQGASIVASAIDFLVTIITVELFGFWYVTGTVTGTVSGGITHFMLGRNWVFNPSKRNIPKQVLKYFIVWKGSLLLNSLGVYVVTHYAGVNYIYSKVLVSVLVGFSYNYIIQKRYVFK